MDWGKSLEALLSPKRRTWLILALGLCGMLLILFSRNTDTKPAEDSSPAEKSVFSSEEYVRRLEQRLGDMISEIEGVGSVRVMITLKNTGEYVFAQEEKRNVDKQAEPAMAEISGRVSEKENTELKYVMVESDTGRKQALVQTQLEPGIQGVVIVCEGADNIYVESRIINVVTTAFHIPSTRVCVEKIKEAPD